MIASLTKFKPRQPRVLIAFQACDIVNVTLKNRSSTWPELCMLLWTIDPTLETLCSSAECALPLPPFHGAYSSPLSMEEFRLASPVTLIKWKTRPASALQCSTICRWKAASSAPCSAHRMEWTALLKATHLLMVKKKGQRPHSERL